MLQRELAVGDRLGAVVHREAATGPGSATGRRKEAIARVRLIPGSGTWRITPSALTLAAGPKTVGPGPISFTANSAPTALEITTASGFAATAFAEGIGFCGFPYPKKRTTFV